MGIIAQSMVGIGLIISLAACATGDRVATDSDKQPSSSSQSQATVIDLTQVGCQFLEVEAQDYQYQPQEASDCQKINSETIAMRTKEFKPLALKPGKYIFRVQNKNVPYPLGFYLRGEGLKQVSLPKVSGGGITQGVTKDYEITLKPGKYLFSCPLNPTPDYSILVN
ncbi:MAG: hypothetical protein QNJ34_25895 [Xenococcaceae cyanobacterium MO_188.B29]|nr:hypothetical protein [Xenococcaceae cyanobacterium MO_188.B29]